MNFDIISALIGAVATLLVAFVTYFATMRSTCRQVYANNVSQSRMEWIVSFRAEMAKVVSALKLLSKDDLNCSEKLNIKNEAEQARFILLTKLNLDITQPGNENNYNLAVVLKDIDFNEIHNVETTVNELLKYTQYILEYEWKRVKREAKGKRK